MYKLAAYICLPFIFMIGCATTTYKPPKTQLQIREFQTREYDTKDVKMVMKALLNVLQDDGYIVKNANVDLGLLSAEKDVDVESKAQAFICALLAGQQARWKKHCILECSGNVSEHGDKTKVRINFQGKTIDNKGAVMAVNQIDDPNFYQEFFFKVDKGIFIGEQKL
ncbi:MAG: hypothetical protein ACLFUU_11005 [Desulfobacteraceae bacterium]